MLSTIQIGDRTFPSMALICPEHDEENPSSDLDRSLGYLPADKERYIPAENGIIFAVQPRVGVDPALEDAIDVRWDIHLMTLSCRLTESGDEKIWLPHYVSLYKGKLQLEIRDRFPRMIGSWNWRGCEDWWVVEHIDRISVMEFTIPDGPRCRMVSRDEILEEHT